MCESLSLIAFATQDDEDDAESPWTFTIHISGICSRETALAAGNMIVPSLSLLLTPTEQTAH